MRKKAQQLDLFAAFGMEPEQKEVTKASAPPPPPPPPIPIPPAPAPPVSVLLKAPSPPAQVYAESIVEEKAPAFIKKSRPVPISSGKRGRKSFRDMDAEVDLISVPPDDVLKEKLYYPISEVAGWFRVNTSLLRFWENEFDIIQPRKTRKGDRLFRVEDIKNLQLIYYLLRQRKFSIDGAKKYLASNKNDIDKQYQLIQSLNRFRSLLLELKSRLTN
ncbi:MAG: MerR family transcriptional regulator [Bacteroidota bacterium]